METEIKLSTKKIVGVASVYTNKESGISGSIEMAWEHGLKDILIVQHRYSEKPRAKNCVRYMRCLLSERNLVIKYFTFGYNFRHNFLYSNCTAYYTIIKPPCVV